MPGGEYLPAPNDIEKTLTGVSVTYSGGALVGGGKNYPYIVVIFKVQLKRVFTRLKLV